MICRWTMVYMINAWSIHISIFHFIFDTLGLASARRLSTGVSGLFVRHLEPACLYTPLLHSRNDSTVDGIKLIRLACVDVERWLSARVPATRLLMSGLANSGAGQSASPLC